MDVWYFHHALAIHARYDEQSRQPGSIPISSMPVVIPIRTGTVIGSGPLVAIEQKNSRGCLYASEKERRRFMFWC